MVYNYLSNAIKFTGENGVVELRAVDLPNGGVRIEVEDSGIGIAAEDLALLFQQFQQLDSGPAKRFQGTGLGLALVKKLVEQHGGSVSVSSEPGVGSCFTATFPPIGE